MRMRSRTLLATLALALGRPAWLAFPDQPTPRRPARASRGSTYRGRAPEDRLPRRPDDRGDRRERAHQRRRLGRARRRRHQEPVGRPGHPGRRLLPGHLDHRTPTTAGTTTPSSSSGSRPGGTASWSSAARRAPGGSTPTTSSSATGCSPRATRSRAPTRATTAPTFYRDGRRPGRLDPRVEPPRHRADPGHQGRRRAALRPRAAADLHVRHLQRRLPHPLAAREPPRAVRRRARLGGHALPADGPQPVDLPAHRAEELPGVRRDR